MPRKLQAFITNLGFFELAIAAPSMKAALEAWGMDHNAFQRGFAKATDDPAIVAATMASPGTVLKRAVGSDGPFTHDAELPDRLPNIRPPRLAAHKPSRQAKARAPAKAPPDAKAARAAILSFEAARKKRDKARAEEERRQEKERAQSRRATEKAQGLLDDAAEKHDAAMAAIERERDTLDRRAEKEAARWEAQRKKLSAAIAAARK